MMVLQNFADLPALAGHLRSELENKKYILLYAFNGTGKTRLSMAFKDIGKQGEARDTLYFNAFTEDLFYWDNDLANDRERVLKINKDSRFFAGLDQLEMDNRIRPLLGRYADFDFRIDTTEWEVSFSREITTGEGEHAKTVTVDDIKVSRGEENIFIWCFFLAIVQLVIDGAQAYGWVKYLYEENKAYFKKILNDFLSRYPFNPELFPAVSRDSSTSKKNPSPAPLADCSPR